jgi:hypothetical protein
VSPDDAGLLDVAVQCPLAGCEFVATVLLPMQITGDRTRAELTVHVEVTCQAITDEIVSRLRFHLTEHAEQPWEVARCRS